MVILTKHYMDQRWDVTKIGDKHVLEISRNLESSYNGLVLEWFEHFQASDALQHISWVCVCDVPGSLETWKRLTQGIWRINSAVQTFKEIPCGNPSFTIPWKSRKDFGFVGRTSPNSAHTVQTEIGTFNKRHHVAPPPSLSPDLVYVRS